MVQAALATCLFGCFGGLATAAGVDPDTVNPCKLITQAEAQSALGMPVKPGEFDDGVFRTCTFKPVNDGSYYLAVSLYSIDKATFDKADPRQFERATGTPLDAFFGKATPLVSVWHAGNQLQIQIKFAGNDPYAGVRDPELKLAAIAVTRF